jgi:hypothetical protein
VEVDGPQDRLFAGPVRGKLLRGGALAIAKIDFLIAKRPAQKLLGVPFDHLRNAQTLDNFAA